MAQSQPPASAGRTIGIALVSCGVACLAGSLGFVALAMGSQLSMDALGVLPLILAVMSVAGLPGFLLMRVILHLTRRTAIPWFAVAGMANGVLFMLVISSGSRHLFDRSDVFLLGISGIVGLISGATYRWVERALHREPEGVA